MFSLYKNNLKTMLEVLYRATKYMNVEDALLAREEKPKKKEKEEDTQRDQGRKKARTGAERDEGRFKPLGGSFTSFTPFPGKLKGDPNKRSRDKYYHFHRDHGHDTTDCYDFKLQIEAFIRQGKLQKFVSKERTDPPSQEQHPRRVMNTLDPS